MIFSLGGIIRLVVLRAYAAEVCLICIHLFLKMFKQCFSNYRRILIWNKEVHRILLTILKENFNYFPLVNSLRFLFLKSISSLIILSPKQKAVKTFIYIHVHLILKMYENVLKSKIIHSNKGKISKDVCVLSISFS